MMRPAGKTGFGLWRWFRRRSPLIQGYVVASYVSTLVAILYFAGCDPIVNRVPGGMLLFFIVSPFGLPFFVLFTMTIEPLLGLAWCAVAFLTWAAWSLPSYRTQWRDRLIAERRRKCLCVHCGYDLRGNPSYVCPECGWSSRPYSE